MEGYVQKLSDGKLKRYVQFLGKRIRFDALQLF